MAINNIGQGGQQWGNGRDSQSMRWMIEKIKIKF